MRRFSFTFLLCAALCAAGGAKCFAAEVIHVPDRADIVVGEDGSVDVYEYDSVSSNDVPLPDLPDSDSFDSLTAEGLLSILDHFSAAGEPDPSTAAGDEINIVQESVSENSVDFDVMYYDHVDDDGNTVTSKYTQYQEDSTLYVTREDFRGGLSTFAVYDTYYGLISTQYLDLFRGLVAKLGINEHYVCARVSQYQYIFAHSENLTLSGKRFTGSNVKVVIYRTDNNGSFTSAVDANFSLNAQSYVVYSDLGNDFPSLLENKDIYSRATFFLLGICVVAYFINSFFGKGVVTNALRKSKKREVY